MRFRGESQCVISMTTYNAMYICQGICDSGGNVGVCAIVIFLSQNKNFSCVVGKVHRQKATL